MGMSNAPYVGLGSSQGNSSPEAANVATFITLMIQVEHQRILTHSALSLKHTTKSVLMLPAFHLMPQ